MAYFESAGLPDELVLKVFQFAGPTAFVAFKCTNRINARNMKQLERELCTNWYLKVAAEDVTHVGLSSTIFLTRNLRIVRLPNGHPLRLPTHIVLLDVSGNGLFGLPDLPDYLMELICTNNDMPVLPSLPIALTKLSCSLNRVEFLPDLPSSLRILDCSHNYIRRLESLPQNLGCLMCRQNGRLSELPQELPQLLTRLDCGYCLIVQLPPLPPNLRMLSCKNNMLSTLPALPESLTHLDISSNNLQPMFTLPAGLKELHCILTNGWDRRVPLPPNLTVLSIRYAPWSVLVSPADGLRFPTGLKWLFIWASKYLGNNADLPASLQDLRINMCDLRQVPVLPPRLRLLDVNHNRRTSLPALPITLKELACADNLITELPPLPPGLSRLVTTGYGIDLDKN